jgi:hypothetical protein
MHNGEKMKLNRRMVTIASVGTLSLALTGIAVPANATTIAVPHQAGLAISEQQLLELAPPSQVQTTIDALVSGVDQGTRIYDERMVPEVLVSSEIGVDFRSEYLKQGGTVIGVDGTLTQGTQTIGTMATGSAWVDGWGFHMTVPRGTMERLVGLAATGSAGAGGIAALLAINIEGFPVSTTGALAAGAVAVALISISGSLQLCNINGNGAQVNYNWVMYTCWPL